MDNQVKQIECLITGRVQLVMFRDFVQREARKLGATGTVENLSDGSVRVVAQGSEDKLLKLIFCFRKGSVLAKVENVSTEWVEARQSFKDFKIIY